MGFRYQRRINLGSGWGFNLSKSGISSSYRGRWGSVGRRGISLRTGIPGLTYLFSSRKQKSEGFIVDAVIWFFSFVVVSGIFIIHAAFFIVLPAVIQLSFWLVLWLFDIVVYLVKNRNRNVVAGMNEIKVQESFGSPIPSILNEESGLAIRNNEVKSDPESCVDIQGLEVFCSNILGFIHKAEHNQKIMDYCRKTGLIGYGSMPEGLSLFEFLVVQDIYKILQLSSELAENAKLLILKYTIWRFTTNAPHRSYNAYKLSYQVKEKQYNPDIIPSTPFSLDEYVYRIKINSGITGEKFYLNGVLFLLFDKKDSHQETHYSESYRRIMISILGFIHTIDTRFSSKLRYVLEFMDDEDYQSKLNAIEQIWYSSSHR